MNKKFTLAAGAFIMAVLPAVASTSTPLRADRVNNVGLEKIKVGEGGIVAPPAKAKRAAEVEHQWQSIGTGRFTDDVITAFFFVDIQTYDVEVEQSVDTPTLYRIVNPLQNHPQLDEMIAAEGEFPTDKDYYIAFDVTDPDMVKIPYSEFGYQDADGLGLFCSKSGEYESLGYTLEEARAASGVFRDNIISFEVPSSCFIVQNNRKFASNESGALRLVLPGGVDYSVSFENHDGFCPGENGRYSVTVNTGAEVPTVRYGLFDNLEDENVMQLISGGSECRPGDTLDLDLSQFWQRKVYLIAITLDSEGMYRDGLYTVLYNPADDSDEWNFYSYADFTDGLLNVYQADITPRTIEVTVQELSSCPGYWRIVEPYAGLADDYMCHNGHNHGHYIYLDVSNPMNVVLKDSPVGVYGDDYGDILVGSDYWFMVEEFGQEEVDGYGIDSGGLFADGVVTFNAEASLCIYPSNYGEWYTTNVKEDGSTGDFMLSLKDVSDGIAEVGGDGAAVEYYNLQGHKVLNPQPGAVCIRRHGADVRKIIVR